MINCVSYHSGPCISLCYLLAQIALVILQMRQQIHCYVSCLLNVFECPDTTFHFPEVKYLHMWFHMDFQVVFSVRALRASYRREGALSKRALVLSIPS